jgi:putative transposase
VKCAWIAAEKALYPVSKLCRGVNVSRSAFYAWQARSESAHARRDRQLRVLIRASHEASRGADGSPRVHRDLTEQQVGVSRKRVARLMREEGLQARRRRRFKGTTRSDPDQPVAPNLLDRQFTAAQPNQRWVSDTTEVLVATGGKRYLAAILDLYSRFCVGWALGPTNDRHLTIAALVRALTRRGPDPGLLHHSDRGGTYASHDYQAILKARGITCSMSRTGDCYDNAVMESFFSTVKAELGEHFASDATAQRALFDYLEVFYNQRRRHSTLGYLSPAAFERQAAEVAVTAIPPVPALAGGIVHPAEPGDRRSWSLL